LVRHHPALQHFPGAHPEVREERSRIHVFIHQERRFDRGRSARGDRDVTRGELANMDRS